MLWNEHECYLIKNIRMQLESKKIGCNLNRKKSECNLNLTWDRYCIVPVLCNSYLAVPVYYKTTVFMSLRRKFRDHKQFHKNLSWRANTSPHNLSILTKHQPLHVPRLRKNRQVIKFGNDKNSKPLKMKMLALLVVLLIGLSWTFLILTWFDHSICKASVKFLQDLPPPPCTVIADAVVLIFPREW